MANLSKVNVLGTEYDLKDASARSNFANLLGSHALEALGTAAWQNVVGTMTGDGIANAATVKNYVDTQVSTIHNFDVVIYTTLPTADEAHMYILGLVADASSEAGSYLEYIVVRSGSVGSYTYAWEQIGSTKTDLSDYVKKTTTIAGVDLQDNITNAEMQNALGLKTLAHKSSAEVTYAKADGISIDSYTPEGTVSLNNLKQTSTAAVLTKGNYTPAGSITGSAIDGGSIEVTLKNATAQSSAALAFEGYTPTGNITFSGKEMNVHKTSANIKPVTSVGTMTTLDLTKFNGGAAATWTGANYVAPSLGAASNASFANEGIVASVDGTNETLVFGNANTAKALTAQGTFSAGSVDFGTFNGGSAASLGAGFYNAGSVPQLGSEVSFLNAVDVALNDSFAASFVGDENNIKLTSAKYYQQAIDNATFTGNAATLGFSGTLAQNILVTGVSYDKATANGATFTGNAGTLTGNVLTNANTVAVNFAD